MRDHAVVGGTDVTGTHVTFHWGFTLNDPYMIQVDKIIAEHGWTPLGEPSRVLYATNNKGELVGFHCLQFMPHVEPLWVADNHMGSGLAGQLADRMLQFMLEMSARGFMVVADSPHTVKLCRDRGMKLVTSPVFIL